jgi:ubiquinone/menaquinone biosynthesis C-methylase UbiE
MSERVCPWWIGYFLVSPLRRALQNPAQILAPYVRDGMTVLEPGPGMGFFTLDLARLVGPSGRVVAVDVQSRMLDALRRRAAKAGLAERVTTRLAQAGSLGVGDLAGRADFVLAFAVVHELPSAPIFFAEAAASLRPGGALLLAEPTGHVSADAFAGELQAAAAAGLTMRERPSIRSSHAALLIRTGG